MNVSFVVCLLFFAFILIHRKIFVWGEEEPNGLIYLIIFVFERGGRLKFNGEIPP